MLFCHSSTQKYDVPVLFSWRVGRVIAKFWIPLLKECYRICICDKRDIYVENLVFLLKYTPYEIMVDVFEDVIFTRKTFNFLVNKNLVWCGVKSGWLKMIFHKKFKLVTIVYTEDYASLKTHQLTFLLMKIQQ